MENLFKDVISPFCKVVPITTLICVWLLGYFNEGEQILIGILLCCGVWLIAVLAVFVIVTFEPTSELCKDTTVKLLQ